jgi:general secretion pathway protein A
MYSQHFGLHQEPFSIAPDPRYLFMSERHREALAHLLYGVAGPKGNTAGTGGGFVLLTGDIGTGKTTICRCFLEQIPSGCHVAYIFNPKLSVLELLQSIGEEFHLSVATPDGQPATLKAHIDALNAFLLRSHAAGESCVLVIDEAQNLQADVLEQLRLLTNLETNERKLLQIVLIGQPELRTLLARPDLEQLAQRVIARFHLDALSEAESTQYIAHRLKTSGLSGPMPFDRRALQRIYHHTHGVPRRINLLCGRALLGAWAQGLARVDRKVVDQAAAEMFDTDPAATATTPRWQRSTTAWAALLALALLVTGVGATAGWWTDWGKLIGWNGTTETAQPDAPATTPGTETPAAGSAPSATPGTFTSGTSTPGTTDTTGPASTAAHAAAEPPPAPASAPIEEMETLWSQLPTDINVAWRELSPVWERTTAPTALTSDPCQVSDAQPLPCYRAGKRSILQVRQLDRPGILTLQSGHEPPVYAVLMGLTEQTATLRINGQAHTVRLMSLIRLWLGDFATYWRPPAGYAESLKEGSSGPAVEHLSRQLGLLDGTPPPQPGDGPLKLDSDLRARVRAFQRAHGLTPDGQPGPMTFMQIDSATGTDAPRLHTPTPSPAPHVLHP